MWHRARSLATTTSSAPLGAGDRRPFTSGFSLAKDNSETIYPGISESDLLQRNSVMIVGVSAFWKAKLASFFIDFWVEYIRNL